MNREIAKLERQLEQAMDKYQALGGELSFSVFESSTGQYLLDRWRNRIEQVDTKLGKLYGSYKQRRTAGNGYYSC